MLYSDRCPEFKTEKGIMKAVQTCREFGIDGIVAIGGDGTFRGATDLTMHGVPCIGIPGTIDNDVSSTDYTIGFDTAMNTVVDMVDRLRDTCESHARCNVVEVMGRGAGDIALNAGIASGATATVIPEFPIDDDAICRKISTSRRHGKRNFIILVSEGVGSDYAPALAEKIMMRTGVDTKFARLAHVVRGGNPTLRDRVMASEMGTFAVKELLAGNSDIVICSRNGEIVATDINYALELDRLYKGKVTKDELVEKFGADTVEKMCAEAAERRRRIEMLYNVEQIISL
jgi:6-phosphofructokinase 1